jgi:hypothetical protein
MVSDDDGSKPAFGPEFRLRALVQDIRRKPVPIFNIIPTLDAGATEIETLRARVAAMATELRETDEALGDYTVNLIRSLPEAAAKLRAEHDQTREALDMLKHQQHEIAKALRLEPVSDSAYLHYQIMAVLDAVRGVPSAGTGREGA